MPDPAPREESALSLTELLQWLGDDAQRRESVESIQMVNALAEAVERDLHAVANGRDAQLQRDLAEARRERDDARKDASKWLAVAQQRALLDLWLPKPERSLTEAANWIAGPACRVRGALQHLKALRALAKDAAVQAAAHEKLLSQLSSLEEERGRLREEIAAGTVSDGYHTHRELYEYRMLYNAHAAHGWLAAGIPVVKSRRHSDGEECFGGGWFIVTATLPTGQVSNHYRDEHWGLFDVPAVELPPEYDGHTPADAAERLRAALPPSPQEAE